MPTPHIVQAVHIRRALEQLKKGQAIPAHRESRKYDLLYQGKRYPPEYVLSIANSLAAPDGELHGFEGGKRANNFLKSRGFEVVDKRVSTRRIASPRPLKISDRERPHNLSAESAIKGQRFWIVSPNVTASPRKLDDWKKAIVTVPAAFMGWGPNDQKHKRMGVKFAHEISPNDVILIARRNHYRPEVVGFGVVSGPYRTTLMGFTPPDQTRWHGSLRRLSPFVPCDNVPQRLRIMRVLAHTSALRELHPTADPVHRKICEWLISQLPARNQKAARVPKKETPNEMTLLKSISSAGQLDYKLRTREALRRAKRAEAQLVEQYEKWLKKYGRELAVATYRRLQCDAFEEARGNLIEAKSSARREYIRMAVGQLLDYEYLGRDRLWRPHKAILLPNKPDANVMAWLTELKISVIWKYRSGFVDNANWQFA